MMGSMSAWPVEQTDLIDFRHPKRPGSDWIVYTAVGMIALALVIGYIRRWG